MKNFGFYILGILTVLFLTFFSNSRKQNPRVHLEIIHRGSTYVEYSMQIENELPLILGYDAKEGLRVFSNLVHNKKQVLDFHDNGYLAVKSTLDSVGHVQNGRYYFFESNGNLANNYNYFNGHKVGVAKSYFDDVHYLREYMEYDSIGNMYYRRTYDKLGNTVNEEGS